MKTLLKKLFFGLSDAPAKEPKKLVLSHPHMWPKKMQRQFQKEIKDDLCDLP